MRSVCEHHHGRRSAFSCSHKKTLQAPQVEVGIHTHAKEYGIHIGGNGLLSPSVCGLPQKQSLAGKYGMYDHRIGVGKISHHIVAHSRKS